MRTETVIDPAGLYTKAEIMSERSESNASNCSAVRWAIVGIHGLYTGQYLRRKDAIREHVNALFIIPGPNYPNEKEAWEYCKAKGDRAVRVSISWQNDRLHGREGSEAE